MACYDCKSYSSTLYGASPIRLQFLRITTVDIIYVGVSICQQ